MGCTNNPACDRILRVDYSFICHHFLFLMSAVWKNWGCVYSICSHPRSCPILLGKKNKITTTKTLCTVLLSKTTMCYRASLHLFHLSYLWHLACIQQNYNISLVLTICFWLVAYCVVSLVGLDWYCLIVLLWEGRSSPHGFLHNSSICLWFRFMGTLSRLFGC